MNEPRVERDQSCVIPREENVVRYSVRNTLVQRPADPRKSSERTTNDANSKDIEPQKQTSDGIDFLHQRDNELLIIDSTGTIVTEEPPTSESP